MPLYTYKHKETGEEVEIIQRMSEDKIYNGADGTEVDQWARVFNSFSINGTSGGKLDPFDEKSISKAMEGKDGVTLGEMWDLSAELSEQRAEMSGGEDPVKQEYYKRHEEATGEKHHADKFSETYEGDGIKVEIDTSQL